MQAKSRGGDVLTDLLLASKRAQESATGGDGSQDKDESVSYKLYLDGNKREAPGKSAAELEGRVAALEKRVGASTEVR